MKALESACWSTSGTVTMGPMWRFELSFQIHKYDLDAYEKYVVWFVTACERMMKDHTKFIIIFDMAGWGLWMSSTFETF